MSYIAVIATKSTDVKSLKIVLTRISKKSWSTSKNDNNRSKNSDGKNTSNVVTDKATPKPILVCKFCKKKFKTVSKLTIHKNKYHDLYTCRICG